MNINSRFLALFLGGIVGIHLSQFARGQKSGFDKKSFDVQGHRGFRGRWPENTWKGMRAAMEAGVHTLEMDVVMSRDGYVLLSHEPWMNPQICEGAGIGKQEPESLNLYKMDYSLIRTYQCGSPQGHPGFPLQQSYDSPKPLLSEIMDSVMNFCQRNSREVPGFNIEIKSRPGWDSLYHPSVHAYVRSVVEVIHRSGLKERCMVQSFDQRVPVLVHRLDSTLATACLVEHRRVWSRSSYAQTVMSTWGRGSGVYSPHFRMLTRGTVKKLQGMGIKVIPWTVNKPLIMNRLMRWGVDGIITDYPDILVGLRQTRAGQTP
jgi:glycerophosphoryl diester phosphodiesterase